MDCLRPGRNWSRGSACRRTRTAASQLLRHPAPSTSLAHRQIPACMCKAPNTPMVGLTREDRRARLRRRERQPKHGGVGIRHRSAPALRTGFRQHMSRLAHVPTTSVGVVGAWTVMQDPFPNRNDGRLILPRAVRSRGSLISTGGTGMGLLATRQPATGAGTRGATLCAHAKLYDARQSPRDGFVDVLSSVMV